ncbi:sugar phosphate isomerase/epimerase [Actinopolymorpha sp. B17G11]|uniref:sugar phosphate isomerase/epimerase family protein n=1 Tax=Actinopolymorpha sp. B17G11 TaxID=3160861 RepID=UPI0032E4E0E4
MHLSTHTWMRPEPLEVTLRRIGRFGYGSVELSGEPHRYDIADTRRQLADTGISCWGVVTIMQEPRNLAASEEKQRARTVDYFRSLVDLAAALDGQVVTVVPATVGKIVPDATPEEEWRWVVEGLREVYADCERHGIRLALEPLNRFETYFLNRVDQALALAAEVGPECGVALDTFHMNIEEADFLDAIRSAAGRIWDVHVADNNRFAPGMGSLDWTAIVSTLQEVRYTGALTVEFVAPVDRTPVSPYPNQVDKNQPNVSAEELAYIRDHGSSLLTEEFYTSLVQRSAETLRPLYERTNT